MTHVTGGDLVLLQTVSRGQSTHGFHSQPLSIQWMSLSDTLRCAHLFLHYSEQKWNNGSIIVNESI